MFTQGALYGENWELTVEGPFLSPGKHDFTVHFEMFEILMFFEKFPTFYFRQLVKKFLIKLSCPAGRYYICCCHKKDQTVNR